MTGVFDVTLPVSFPHPLRLFRPTSSVHAPEPQNLLAVPVPVTVPAQPKPHPFVALVIRLSQILLPLPPPSSSDEKRQAGYSAQRFRPYVAKIPWHGGVRGFLSQLFPRYGHYCGPNWSSGKDQGSLLWDRRPIDWLDSCCYCHDIGYDTHDQARLLQADLTFLRCLQQPRPSDHIQAASASALLYRTMCITGLKTILIPYRTQLVRLQSSPSILEMLGSLIHRSAPQGLL